MWAGTAPGGFGRKWMVALDSYYEQVVNIERPLETEGLQ